MYRLKRSTTSSKHLLVILNLLAMLLVGWPVRLHAQQEDKNWYFGDHAGLSFQNGSPVYLTDGALVSYEPCATLSDPTGNLLYYSNGEQVWNRNHMLLPNGSGLGGHNSASNGVTILPQPGSATLYYLFVVDAIDNNLVGGLRYSIIDKTLQGGLGDVTSAKAVRLPTPTLTGKVTEKIAAVRHANGRDYWIVVHGWQSNVFYSFLLTSSGISTTPVSSTVGSVHQGGGSFFGAANAVGCMRASRDGKHLALAKRDTGFELYDFNDARGAVSNYIPLNYSGYSYGTEFSPDGSRLYCSTGTEGGIIQFNLLAGSTAAIASSGTYVANIAGVIAGLQSAPDGKIYAAVYNSNYLAQIDNPNALGAACAFRNNALYLGGKLSQNNLPNFPNAFAHNTVTATAAANQFNEQTTMFPNPTHDQVSFTFPASSEKQALEVKLYNVMGQQVKQLAIPPGYAGKETSLLLKDLAKGIYTVEINSSAGTVTKRLMVE